MFPHDARPEDFFGACTMRKLFAAIGALVLLAMPSMTFALTTINADSTGLSTTGKGAFGEGIATTENSSLSGFIGGRIIAPIFGLVGLGFFCLAIYAGVLWMTAMGDPKKVDKAKDILTSATIGLVIIVASYVLTNAVLSGITSGTII